MSVNAPTIRPSSEIDSVVSRKRLRKGTHSCKECKRRKVRCMFTSNKAVVCIGCQRRGTPCLSQEAGDEPPGGDEISMRARLMRVERMLGLVMEKMMPEGMDDEEDLPDGNFANQIQDGSSRELSQRPSSAAIQTIQDGISVSSGSESYSSRPAPQSMNLLRVALYEALPSQQVADLVIGNPHASAYIQTLCNFAKPEEWQPPLVVAALPSVASHPVILARKLLQFSISLQQVDPSFDFSQFKMTEPCKIAMERYFNLATSSVTSNDAWLDSIEGLQCLLLEGAYLINSGNLRRAWFCLRRATSIAQYLGVHRGSSTSPPVLDSRTKASATMIWMHIMYGERYLSLLLGMPSSIPSTQMLSDGNQVDSTPIERLNRIHVEVFGLIIERNENAAYQDYPSILKIDNDLQMVAKSILPDWWLPPDLKNSTDLLQAVVDLIRAQTQVIHFNVLTLLHLPYMLTPSSERMYDYSKIMCFHSSREVLGRFLSFRAVVNITTCCKWVDFCTFTASITLLLGHLESVKTGTVSIEHRLSDRALIFKAMETMDELNKTNKDQLSRETAEVTRKFLSIEQKAFETATPYNVATIGDSSNCNITQPGLDIKIPYFGTVRISNNQSEQHQSTVKSSAGSALTPLSSINPGLEPPYDTTVDSLAADSWDVTTSHNGWDQEQLRERIPCVTLQEDFSDDGALPDFPIGADEWAFQGVDLSYFNTLLQGEPVGESNWGIELP